MDEGDRLTVQGHWYLVDYKPDYIVMPSEAMYSANKPLKFEGPHMRASYLREWLIDNTLHSPYMPERPRLREVFSTPNTVVLETEQ